MDWMTFHQIYEGSTIPHNCSTTSAFSSIFKMDSVVLHITKSRINSLLIDCANRQSFEKLWYRSLPRNLSWEWESTADNKQDSNKFNWCSWKKNLAYTFVMEHWVAQLWLKISKCLECDLLSRFEVEQMARSCSCYMQCKTAIIKIVEPLSKKTHSNNAFLSTDTAHQAYSRYDATLRPP
jgi:hypothetical protein